MADMWLAWKFFSRVNPSTKVILVGDPDQLPSVGPGAVFSELIQCGLIPVTTILVEIEETGKDFEKRAVLIFGRNRVTYSLEALGNVELAYATTIHKMMGSETEVVLIPILKSQYIMLYRNLIYTAITRAKKKVILVGQKAALYMAIHRADTSKRNTYLGQRIKLYVKAYRKVPEFFSAGLKDAV